jgi:hypothetical protein
MTRKPMKSHHIFSKTFVAGNLSFSCTYKEKNAYGKADKQVYGDRTKVNGSADVDSSSLRIQCLFILSGKYCTLNLRSVKIEINVDKI